MALELETKVEWSVVYISKDPALAGRPKENKYGPRERSARFAYDRFVAEGYEGVGLIKTTIAREKIK